MDSIERLTDLFKKLPGIGSRQAKRFVYFLLAQDQDFPKELSSLILELKENISQCSSCYRFFKIREDGVKMCGICSDPNTDTSLLMVVEKDVDLENIQKTNTYSGLYFVLGGNIPILEKDPASRIRVKEMFNIVQKNAQNGLKEVILALSVNPEGENTLQYVRKILEPLEIKYKIKISALGRGLSTGTELEYSDSNTLENALKNRM